MKTTTSLKRLITELLLTLLFNSIIAVFLLLIIDKSLTINMIYSHSIGLSTLFISYALLMIRQLSKFDIKKFLISIPMGGIIGIFIANQIIGNDLKQLIADSPNLPFILLACTLIFGTIISYYFYARTTIAEKNLALQEATLQRLADEKNLTETRLKLLQAQIEPHFLFNTLSNILSLIDEEPPRAKIMLERFTHYLRASLTRTRQEQSTFGDELALLRAYLDIHSIRMGERLHYLIEVPKPLQTINLPPLLLQPLVENAIKHGLAPSIAGGTIHITAKTQQKKLEISIKDTGIGLQGELGNGMGLNNIRARLRALYGNRAKMTIQQNTPCGVQVTLSIHIEPPK
ncbi:MAG: histidine kinase [Pseudomonadota bacterium]